MRCQILDFCDENVPDQTERWISLPQTPKPPRFTILLSCSCTSNSTMAFMEAPSHLKSPSGLLQSPREPHEGFGESFSFSLSLSCRVRDVVNLVGSEGRVRARPAAGLPRRPTTTSPPLAPPTHRLAHSLSEI